MGTNVTPSTLHMCPFQSLQPHHITWWSSPILCGCSGRHPWVEVATSSFIHPREALLVGHQVTALPLFSCGIHFHSTSFRGKSCMRWGWYTCPMYDSCPYTRECQPLMQWEVSFGLSGACMTFHVGSSLCKRGQLSVAIWCATSQVSSSHLPLIFLFPLKASASTSMRSPGFKFTVHLSFCCSTVFVGMLPPLIGLVPPIGWSSMYPIWKLHIHPHAWWRPLLWGSALLPTVGNMKVNQEPRPFSKHQIVWTLPGNCRSGGIIGMCTISAKWYGQLAFLSSPGFLNHAHNCLVWCLYQPISLGVVGHVLQSFYTKDLAYFLNYTTGEVSTSIS